MHPDWCYWKVPHHLNFNSGMYCTSWFPCPKFHFLDTHSGGLARSNFSWWCWRKPSKSTQCHIPKLRIRCTRTFVSRLTTFHEDIHIELSQARPKHNRHLLLSGSQTYSHIDHPVRMTWTFVKANYSSRQRYNVFQLKQIAKSMQYA